MKKVALSLDSSLKEIFTYEESRAVFDKFLPGMRTMTEKQPATLGFSVRKIIQFSGGAIPAEAADALDAARCALELYSAEPEMSDTPLTPDGAEIVPEPPRDAIYPGKVWRDTNGRRIQAHGCALYYDDGVYYWIPDWQRPLKEQERQKKGYPDDYPLVAGAWGWIGENINSYPRQIEICTMEELPMKLNKMNATDREGRIHELYRSFEKEFTGQYEFVRTGPRLIEISPKGITKGQTLKRLMEAAGIRPEEVMAFGDGENDVDMFRTVKYGIAVGNAADYVKEHAFDVTATNNEDGIAAALEKYGVI